jgi:transglutaminase-like putative cysteine protease
MQRYKIIHRTYYNYTDEVTLGSHQLRLRPREDHELRIELFELNISPIANIFWHRDVEGNSVAIANFMVPTNQLLIESEVIIQQYNESPLDFIVADDAIQFPFTYTQADNIVLSPYRIIADPAVVPSLTEWMQHFWEAGMKIQSYSLLLKLTEFIFQTFVYKVREEPGVQSAQTTLILGSGSCRDFANLFMEAAKCLGFAARFVSGYLYAPLMSAQVGSTHAWAEVYLPGAGWLAFDPTIGKIVGSDHIAVAVSRLPESVPPIGGSYTGDEESTLDVGVWVSKC